MYVNFYLIPTLIFDGVPKFSKNLQYQLFYPFWREIQHGCNAKFKSNKLQGFFQPYKFAKKG